MRFGDVFCRSAAVVNPEIDRDDIPLGVTEPALDAAHPVCRRPSLVRAGVAAVLHRGQRAALIPPGDARPHQQLLHPGAVAAARPAWRRQSIGHNIGLQAAISIQREGALRRSHPTACVGGQHGAANTEKMVQNDVDALVLGDRVADDQNVGQFRAQRCSRVATAHGVGCAALEEDTGLHIEPLLMWAFGMSRAASAAMCKPVYCWPEGCGALV